jgi:hypothetical protein
MVQYTYIKTQSDIFGSLYRIIKILDQKKSSAIVVAKLQSQRQIGGQEMAIVGNQVVEGRLPVRWSLKENL